MQIYFRTQGKKRKKQGKKEIKKKVNKFQVDETKNLNLKGVLDMEFPFYDAPNTATITCCHIIEPANKKSIGK